MIGNLFLLCFVCAFNDTFAEIKFPFSIFMKNLYFCTSLDNHK